MIHQGHDKPASEFVALHFRLHRSTEPMTCQGCNQSFPANQMYPCPDCEFIGCLSCTDAHVEEPHWCDGMAGKEREAGLGGGM